MTQLNNYAGRPWFLTCMVSIASYIGSRLCLPTIGYDFSAIAVYVGLRELCWNNFGNFEVTHYSRIILGIIEHKRNNEDHNTSNSCQRMVKDRTNQGTKLGTDSEQGNELIFSSLSSMPIVCRVLFVPH